ncbi:transmembrane protein 176B-like [Xyrichtys novacula]|uniref:Transmembrane protein 176B-like n=1 Tax=Xyrichtys novacula TaxID=13765 RepID=A0AAV1FR37_XYRNO|nr:transmembrane protein 176B-like [Xyrichtys novacula]
MSLTKTQVNGVTVVTLTSDPNSSCPPLCQILKTICYSPSCCSLSQQLRRVQGSSQSLLGALQIMVGLLNIGFGAVLTSSAPWWQRFNYLFPFWLGVMFVFFGAMCILSEKRPSPCVVVLNVILSLSGVGFAIAAIILYSINMGTIYLGWMCEESYNYDDYISDHQRTLSPGDQFMKEKCLEAEDMVLMIMMGIYGMLIVLSVLEFCITISSAVLGIKALRRSKGGENQSPDEPEHYKPLQEEVDSNPSV